MQHIPTSGSILHGVLPTRKFMMSSLILPMFKGANCLKVEGGGANCLEGGRGRGKLSRRWKGEGQTVLRWKGRGKLSQGGANCLEGGRAGVNIIKGKPLKSKMGLP